MSIPLTYSSQQCNEGMNLICRAIEKLNVAMHQQITLESGDKEVLKEVTELRTKLWKLYDEMNVIKDKFSRKKDLLISYSDSIKLKLSCPGCGNGVHGKDSLCDDHYFEYLGTHSGARE